MNKSECSYGCYVCCLLTIKVLIIGDAKTCKKVTQIQTWPKKEKMRIIKLKK